MKFCENPDCQEARLIEEGKSVSKYLRANKAASKLREALELLVLELSMPNAPNLSDARVHAQDTLTRFPLTYWRSDELA